MPGSLVLPVACPSLYLAAVCPRAHSGRRARGGLEGRARPSLPELRGDLRPLEPSASSDPAQRHRLCDAVSRALVVCDRPRLLIIDDLQWCDGETIELIGFVVRCGQTALVLIVGTVRSEEIAQQHPLVGLIDALGHDQSVTTVPLGGSTRPLPRRSPPGCAAKRRSIRLWRPESGARPRATHSSSSRPFELESPPMRAGQY